MPVSYRSTVVEADVDTVWSTVRRFDGLPDWHPAIAQSSLDSGVDHQVGAVRRLALEGGGTVVERLLAIDDEHRVLTYTILESPFAVRRYVSTMRVSPVTDTGRTFVEWSAEFDADAADEEQLMGTFGDGVFAGGLAGLRAHHEG